MRIEDVLQALPSREDLAGAMGMEQRPGATSELFVAVGVGVVLGAGLAMLFAPKSGDEIRHAIGAKLGELGEHLQSKVPVPEASSNGTGGRT